MSPASQGVLVLIVTIAIFLTGGPGALWGGGGG